MSGTSLVAGFGPQFLSTGAGSPGVAGGAEVAAYDAARSLVFVLGPNGVDALDAGTLVFRYGLSRAEAQPSSPVTLGGGNSVAVVGNTLAVAYEGSARGQDGAVVFYDLSTATPTLTRVVTGPEFSTPDHIVFTPDGSRLLVAIEGEPGDGYSSDAKGGVAVIDVATGALTFAGFDAFDAQEAALSAAGVRLTGRDAPAGQPNTADPSRDLEPEYIAVNAAGTKAYVTLQENNALGILDIVTASFDAVLPFGLKPHGFEVNGIDPSDRDGGAKIGPWPVFGMMQPDAIATFDAAGRTFIVTANEGDAREWGNFVEPVRISDSSVILDSTAFPAEVAARLKDNAGAGRLEISRFTGDLDGDGDYDQLHVFGGRSISIWEVTGNSLAFRWDGGNIIDATLAAQLPARYDDTRSDNKGAEPEGLTLATIAGELHALVGLERANMLMSFRIDTSAVSSGGSPTGTLSGLLGGGTPASGVPDVAPEVFTYVPGASGAPGSVIVPNEVSGTVRKLDLAAATPGPFTLQILHASDFEAGLLATGRAPNFAAIVDALEGTYANSITLSSGDNWIPGPFLAAGTDPGVRAALASYYEGLFGLAPGSLSGIREGFARIDVAILNAIGIEASVFGNHEFDLGPNPIADAIDFIAGSGSGAGRISSVGAQFPYLSANLDFSGEAALRNLVTATLREASTYATTRADLANDTQIGAEAADAQISPWTTIVENGETIGILGATTQILRSISSPGGVQVIGDDINDMPQLAAILQPYVDQMTAQGINKIVLLSHLQQNALELELATLLRGVDVIIAGGSHAVFADGTDTLRPGDAAANTYPVFRTGADGRPVAVVNTGSEYSYVGRLVVTFDANGVIIPSSVDPVVSGAYATTDAVVDRVAGNADGTLSAAERAAIFADGTRGGEVKQLADAVGAVIAAKDGNVFGYSDVFLEGRRGEVRTEETNLGNLTADANLAYARDFDPAVLISLKNGGGIRAEIGAVVGQPIPSEVPPLANPAAGKLDGGVSQLDIENSLRFNNPLSLATFTAGNLVNLLENALRGVAPGATPGAFPQVGGLSFSFDALRPAGDRVVTLAVLAEDGSIADILVQDGNLVGDASREFRVVTLGFLLDGGDGWTAGVSFTDRQDLADASAGTGFNAAGREQAALAEYLRENFGSPDMAFDDADTAPVADTRIQNIAARADDVLPDAILTRDDGTSVTLAGMVAAGPLPGAFLAFAPGNRSEILQATSARDLVNSGGGNDRVFGNAGADSLDGGNGNDTLLGGSAADTLDGANGNDSLDGAADDDALFGGRGADTMLASAGADTLSGGFDDDLYLIGSAGHLVIEDARGGFDRVQASVNFDLPDFVEDLTLAGAAFQGGGNAAANLIEGNLIANRLLGGAGADTVRGLGGNDTLFGDAGADLLDGGAGNDVLTGGDGGDTLTGGTGSDTFRFLARLDSHPVNLIRQDVITDFVRGQDRLFLDFDADETAPGVQPFAFTTGEFAFFTPGFVRVEAVDATTVRVLANTDDDKGPEFAILVRGAGTLSASDFLF